MPGERDRRTHTLAVYAHGYRLHQLASIPERSNAFRIVAVGAPDADECKAARARYVTGSGEAHTLLSTAWTPHVAELSHRVRHTILVPPVTVEPGVESPGPQVSLHLAAGLRAEAPDVRQLAVELVFSRAATLDSASDPPGSAYLAGLGAYVIATSRGGGRLATTTIIANGRESQVESVLSIPTSCARRFTLRTSLQATRVVCDSSVMRVAVTSLLTTRARFFSDLTADIVSPTPLGHRAALHLVRLLAT